MIGRVLHDFEIRRPTVEIKQAVTLAWLLDAHVAAERTLAHLDDTGTAEVRRRLGKAISRCACNPSQIGSRGFSLDDANVIYDTTVNPHGKGTRARMDVYERETTRYFDAAYADETRPPDDIVHVTCTGYVSPSAAQQLVTRRGWGERTRVTHAYHMGCYAAIPALRIAEGCLRTGARRMGRCDIVHTELCSLHLDPGRHELEQIVVQSLFADGYVRYAMSDDVGQHVARRSSRPTEVLHCPISGRSRMRWRISDHGMEMTLARDVPEKVGRALRSFLSELFVHAGVGLEDLPRLAFAVHPGGPRIIDGVKNSLELAEPQVRFSREVLFDYGNMSSATLPHVWKRMLDVPTSRGARPS